MPTFFTYLKAIPRSLYSAELYREVARKWHALGIVYLCMVVLICLIPAAYRMSVLIDDVFGSAEMRREGVLPERILRIISQVPPMQLENSRMRTEAEQPYTIYDPENNLPFIVVDLRTGSERNIHDNVPIVVSGRSLIVRYADYAPQPIPYTDIARWMLADEQAQVDIDALTVQKWAETAVRELYLMPWILWLWQGFVMSINQLIQVLMFAIFAIVIADMFSLRVRFRTLFRLSAVTTTPILVCEGVSYFLGYSIFAYPSMIYFLLHTVYLYTAVEANVQKA